MAAINWKNRSFINTFGEDLTYTPAGGAPATVRMIFDDDYFDELPGLGLQMRRTSARLLAADAPALANGDTEARQGKTYKVVQTMPDDKGFVEVKLEEQ
jgi:hypothetical protein